MNRRCFPIALEQLVLPNEDSLARDSYARDLALHFVREARREKDLTILGCL